MVASQHIEATDAFPLRSFSIIVHLLLPPALIKSSSQDRGSSIKSNSSVKTISIFYLHLYLHHSAASLLAQDIAEDRPEQRRGAPLAVCRQPRSVLHLKSLAFLETYKHIIHIINNYLTITLLLIILNGVGYISRW